jgi:hypothetical protein
MKVSTKEMVSCEKTPVHNLIPGHLYFVIDYWNLDNSSRRNPVCFQGIFLRYFPWQNESFRAEFMENTTIRTINSHNEFYRIYPMLSPDLNESIVQRAKIITNPKLSFDQMCEIQYCPQIVMRNPVDYFTQDTLESFF